MIPQSAIDVVRPVFTDAGGLRDLIVRAPTVERWAALLAWVTRVASRSTFRVDGAELPPPATFNEAWQFREAERTVILSIDIDGAIVNCHFWNDWEIELDLASRDFQTDQRLGALLEFALGLSSALGERVLLTEDNMHDLPLIEFAPDGSIRAV